MIIEAVNLTKRFNDIVAVDHIGATIRGGSVFGLTGTNGAGKSTFLRLASGMLKPDQGCITVDGHEVLKNIPVKERFFYIPDEQHLFNNTTPMKMMRYYSRVHRGFDGVRFHKLMESFGLDEKQKIYTFSKGMKKQVSVICGVCVGMDYLFYDETFSGLDPVVCQTVKSIFAADMENRNLIPIIASHNLGELEDIYDHVGLFHKGGTLLSKDLDDVRPNIRKIQYVPKLDMRPGDLTSLGKINVGQRGSLRTIAMRGSRSKVKAATVSYEPVFLECIPLSPKEILTGGTEVASYDVRKLIL